MDYNKYIKSKEWRDKRNELFTLKGKECEQCGSTHKINVHHISYDNLGNESLDDLQILCFQCHMSKHDEYFDKFYPNKIKVKKTKPKKQSKRKTIQKRKIDFYDSSGNPVYIIRK